MKNLLTNPILFFQKIKNKEVNLFFPFLILFLVGLFEAIVNVSAIEHTNIQQILGGTFPITRFIYFILVFNISDYLLILIQTIFFPIIIKKLGGTGGSVKHSFYILGLSALPILFQSIIHLIFPATVLWQYFEHKVILYILIYSIFNVFNIWSIVLLIIGFAKVYNVSYKKSSILYLQFVLKLTPLIILTILAR